MVAVPSADQDQPLALQPEEPAVLAAVRLSHRYGDRAPRVLYGKTLVVCYRVLDNGAVTRQLVRVDDPKGNPVPAPRRTFRSLTGLKNRNRTARTGMVPRSYWTCPTLTTLKLRCCPGWKMSGCWRGTTD
jgi:hypothetical protein